MGALISRSRRRCLEVPRINGLLVERKIRQSFFVDPILLVVGLAISHVRSESPKELRDIETNLSACSPVHELSRHNGPFSRKRPEIHSNPQDVKEIGVRVRPGMLRCDKWSPARLGRGQKQSRVPMWRYGLGNRSKTRRQRDRRSEHQHARESRQGSPSCI